MQVGVCYISGRGAPVSEEKAAEMFLLAAQAGDATAQYNIGVCYGKGRGVPKDAVKAAEWYAKSAHQGDAMAQFRLALCYATGKVRHWCPSACMSVPIDGMH
jgi:TPR repeat protein